MSDSLLIGVSPNQVPLNSMLGDLARMSLEELVAMVASAMTQRLSSTGLGAINDLRNTIFERGTPQDVFNTGMTTGLARAGSDGVGIPGFGTDEYGSLIVNAQWNDSSIGPAYNRIYFRSGRMWFQAMKTSTTWDSWIEVLTGGSKAIAALATIGTVAADQIAVFTGASSAGTTNLSALGRSVIANTDLASMMATLGLTGLGVSADLRGNTYEKGTPTTVVNKGLSMGLARGGTDGLSIPAYGTTTNQYGTLLVMAGYSDLSGGPSYNRMFIRGGRLFIQPYSSNTGWGAWTELANAAAIPAGMKTYESDQQAITLDSLYTLAHGLGRVPRFVGVTAVCVNAASGYAVGDTLEIPNVTVPYIANSSGNATGVNIYYDATNLYARVGSFRAFQMTAKTGGSIVVANAADWKLIFKAIA